MFKFDSSTVHCVDTIVRVPGLRQQSISGSNRRRKFWKEPAVSFRIERFPLSLSYNMLFVVSLAAPVLVSASPGT